MIPPNNLNTLNECVEIKIPPAQFSFPAHVALLDDHPLVGASLAEVLNKEPDFVVKYAECEARHLFTALSTDTCDVVVTDFFLPNDRWDGLELIKRMRRAHPDLPFVIYTAAQCAETCSAAYRAGANGFLSKSHPYRLLPVMLRAAIEEPDNFFFCADGKIITGPPPLSENQLTLCEIEVLRQIANGLSVGQVAERLVRSKKTISTHKRRAMVKLDLADDLSLALYLKDRYSRFTS